MHKSAPNLSPSYFNLFHHEISQITISNNPENRIWSACVVFLTDVGVFTAVVLDNIVVYDIGADYFFEMHRSDAGYRIFVVGSVAENGNDVDFVRTTVWYFRWELWETRETFAL